MTIFFELLEKRMGFSRIGRIKLSKEFKHYISTPNILIPIHEILKENLNFFSEFENHELFIISDEKDLKINELQEKFKDSAFIYTHSGTFDKFQEILANNLNIFYEKPFLPIIPFEIPTTTVSKEFSAKEIENYLVNVKDLLNIHLNVDFGLSIRIFDYPELIDMYLTFVKKNENIKILNLVDLFDNFNNFRGIIKRLIQLKRELDNNLLLMVSGRIIPKFYPILVYLGVDLIDTSYLLYLSSENFYSTIEYLLPIYKLKYLPCSCIVCRGNFKKLLTEKYSSEKIKLLCLHNLITAKNYMYKIKQYLRYEDFRAFLEKSSLDDLNIISMLKILDKYYFKLLRYETPLIQEHKTVRCFGSSSIYRPDFQEFRERVLKTFFPEPSTTLIILIPCSKKKPYSESRSHKKFHSIIRRFSDFPNFQEIILTSPLGAIPRQLENIYPVNSYDISVTGDWDSEEINIAAEMLFELLKKFDEKIPIICHVEEGGYLEISKIASTKLQRTFFYSEIEERITSNKSLAYLGDLIKKNKDLFTPNETRLIYSKPIKTWTRKFIKILDYQFGCGSGSKLISNEIKLRTNRGKTQIELIEGKTQDKLGIFKHSSGFIELTLKGAQKISPFSNDSKTITFDGDKLRGNTLFRPGVLEYNLDLIPGENVILLDREKKNVIGVGNMIVGSNYLKNSKSGRIARIYERIK